MRRVLWMLAACAGMAAAARAEVDPAVLKAEADRVAAMNKAKNAVLAVFASNGMGGGSGVVISADGFALTNFHVAKPCGNAMKCGMADGKAYDAVVVGLDPTGDIALIKLVGRDDFPFAEMGDSDQLHVGDECFAMGNPFLLATDYQPTVTFGIVSGVHRYQPPAGTLLEYTDCIQTDASINPGNSGGPLFDLAGRLIGINGRGSFEKRGRVNVGVAYAISINQIKNFLGQLRSGRIVDHATLGATVAFDDQARVIVNDILEESDAYRRGLRYGDEIVAFSGRPIATPNAFKNVLGIFPKGWRVPLSYRRDGQKYDILVRLRGVHGKEELIEKAEGGPQENPLEPKEPPPKRKPSEKPKQPKPGEPPRLPKSGGDTSMTSQTVADDSPAGPPEDKPAEKQPAEKSSPEKKPGEKVPAAKKPAGAKPKAEKTPKDESPDGKDAKRPDIEPKMKMVRPKPPLPEAVKKVFEEKRGFANYYFNKQERDRVWNAWSKQFVVSGLSGPWTLSGELDGGGKFRFQLGDVEATLKLPTAEWSWSPGEKLASSLNPPQSGGLLLALFLWRRLELEGPAKYGDVVYQGTAPLVGRQGLFDVLVGTYRDVESHFYFDPADGKLVAMEVYAEEDEDPCELYFSEYRAVEGRSVPGRLEVRYGDDPFATFKLGDLKFDKPANK